METISSLENLNDKVPPLANINKFWTGFFYRYQWPIFTGSLVASDVLTTGFSFLLAYYIRFDLRLPVFVQDAFISFNYYFLVVCGLIILWLSIFTIMGLYARRNLLGGVQEYSLVFNSTIIGLAIVIITGFLEPNFVLARGWLLTAWPLTFITAAFGRFCLRRVIYSLRNKGFYLTTAIIVGANEEGHSLAHQLFHWKSSGLHIAGFIDKKIQPGTPVLGYLKVLGSVDQIDTIIEQYRVKEIILASSAYSSRDNMLKLFQKYGISNGINVRMSSGFYEIINTGLTVKEFAYVPLVCVNKVRLAGVDRLLKFLLDYFLTIPGLFIFSPLFLLIAIAVKLDSPGPVIYRRRVMGVNGRQFDAFKFRTMHRNGDEILKKYPELETELAENHKLKEDPRITRVGKFLRKTSLDELPQLLNVIKGDMSLVGPRIITPGEVGKYSKWDINLLTVRPGITGLWQVSGRSDISYEERVRLDMYYIRNWSIWIDLQLLLRTIPAVFSRRGAY
ncbi:MAG: sugar transferase [Omnitrophica WOR_2 bacterium]